MEGLSDALQDIATVREQGNPSLRLIGVVLSAIKGRKTRLQRELINYVQTTFDNSNDQFIKSYKSYIGETTYICESQKRGKTMFQLYPDHKVTQQYRDLAQELEERIDSIEAERQPSSVKAYDEKEVVNG
jgi:cellulose biosynthesis protein BcsQ